MVIFKIYRENHKIVIILFNIKMTFKNPFISFLDSICDIKDLEIYKKNNVDFVHSIGIVIQKGVKIGKNCAIFQRVCIGAKNPERGDNKVPTLLDNVKVYANACILGDVTIGNNAIIAANAVVLNDVPSDSIAVGNPARIIKR